MSKRYILTPQADADIAEIFAQSVHKWGMIRTEAYLLDFGAKMVRLAEGNLRGKDCAALLPRRGLGLLYYHINRHYVTFREGREHIEILAIYPDRMDLPRHLAKLTARSDDGDA